VAGEAAGEVKEELERKVDERRTKIWVQDADYTPECPSPDASITTNHHRSTLLLVLVLTHVRREI